MTLNTNGSHHFFRNGDLFDPVVKPINYKGHEGAQRKPSKFDLCDTLPSWLMGFLSSAAN